jgi:predicted MFS family arabinose efflux permease
MEELTSLVIAARDGDLDAFSKMVHRYQQTALAVAYARLGDIHLFSLSAAGAASGGFLGDMIGFRATMVVGSVVIGAGLLVLFLSPIRHVRDFPSNDHK